MAAKKKAPAKKKAAPKKAVAKKAAPVKKIAAAKEAMNKTQIMTHIAEKTGLAKKEVVSVFEELGNVIESHVKKRAVGHFTVPGLMKVKVVRKPATKARKGINPFTKEPTVFKAKPARNVVKVLPLKKLKEMAV